MIKNYFKIAFRSIQKNKLFSGINILGLSIGISASIVIFLLVNYHFSFDRFEKGGDRIYRVVTKFNFSGEIYFNSGVTSPMSAAMRKELTGLDLVAAFRTMDEPAKVEVQGIAGAASKLFTKQAEVIFADINYFNLIGYEWMAGDRKTALIEPNQLVLTADRARLYFPGTSVDKMIGRQVILNDTVITTVSGIVKNIQENTDFSFQSFISRATLEKTSLKPHDWDNWNNTNGASQLLIQVAKGTSAAQIQKKIYALYEKYHRKDEEDKSTTTFILQPLKDLHFNAEYGGYSKPLANRTVLYSLLAVAIFLLLLGCINFINLTTAQSVQRAKEIGVRKTMGGSKMQLIFQFLSETSLLTILAAILSLLLTPLILKAFTDFIPADLHFHPFQQPMILVFLLILIVGVTLLSGFYPAMILSGYKPVLVLKNQAYQGTGKTRQAWLRKMLTISQFVIAQVFIMGTILVAKQINFTLNKELGFRKDAIVYFSSSYNDQNPLNKELLLTKLKAIPEIAMVSLSTAPPSTGGVWSSTIKYVDGKKEIETDVQLKYSDSNFLKLYGLKILAGKAMVQSDTVQSFVINQAYANVLGIKEPEQAIGKTIEWSGKQYPISGVMSDFHQKSLHEVIKPLAMGSWSNVERTFNILLQPKSASGDNWKTGIAKIEKAWKEVYPAYDFEYSFLDEEIARFYNQEKNTATLLKWATALAVLISCLGLLGLVIYSTTQRTKEIGVRKVLGASVTQIVQLISVDFLLLVLLAFIIATPIAWYGMQQWLQNFAYRTEISWWVFAIAGLIMLFTALLTLTIQTVKASLANPVKSLRTE